MAASRVTVSSAQLAAGSRPPVRARRAFTLLELIFVLAVLAILISIAIPSLREFAQGQGGQDCAGQIVNLANYARAKAISDGVVYRLNVDIAAGRFWLTRQLPDGISFEELGDDMGQIATVPDGVTLQWDESARNEQATLAQQTGQVIPERVASSTPYVDFQPSGRTEPATIIVTDRAGKSIQVSCLSATETFRIVVPPPQGAVRR